jgi:hypothetical protein
MRTAELNEDGFLNELNGTAFSNALSAGLNENGFFGWVDLEQLFQMS